LPALASINKCHPPLASLTAGQWPSNFLPSFVAAPALRSAAAAAAVAPSTAASSLLRLRSSSFRWPARARLVCRLPSLLLLLCYVMLSYAMLSTTTVELCFLPMLRGTDDDRQVWGWVEEKTRKCSRGRPKQPFRPPLPAPCMCVRVLEWSSGRLAGQANRHGKNLKGNDLHYSARKKIGAK
jgi:hypothetical protein